MTHTSSSHNLTEPKQQTLHTTTHVPTTGEFWKPKGLFKNTPQAKPATASAAEVEDLLKEVSELGWYDQTYLPEQYFIVKKLHEWRNLDAWPCWEWGLGLFEGFWLWVLVDGFAFFLARFSCV